MTMTILAYHRRHLGDHPRDGLLPLVVTDPNWSAQFQQHPRRLTAI